MANIARRQDGTIFSVRELPRRNGRWTAGRKAEVVCAIMSGILTVQEAMDRYNLSEEELSRWHNTLAASGQEALRVNQIQKQ